MNDTVFDVVIIGAGPAGATLARLIGGERSVLLIESRKMGPNGFTREKCCGGLLAPDAVRQLEKIGLSLPDFVKEAEQPLTVRAIDLHSGHERKYPRPYVNLDRAAFEGWLMSLVPKDVTVLDGYRCTGLHKNGLVWEISVAGKERHDTRFFKGKIVVSAEGAASSLRRRFDIKGTRHVQYIAVQDVFARFGGREASRDEHAAFFHPLFTDFYGWVVPKKDRVLLGVALPPRVNGAYNVPRRMDFLRAALGQAGYEFDGLIRREGCMVLRPGPGDIFYGKDGAFCIGEAAGWISPSSAEGFSYAFASARALAKALLSGGTEDAVLSAYKRRTVSLLANITWKKAKSPFMYIPPLRRFIMRSGVCATRR